MYSTLQANAGFGVTEEDQGPGKSLEKIAKLYDSTLKKLKRNTDTSDVRTSVYGALKPS